MNLRVTVLTTEAEIVDSLMEGQKGTVFVEKTPFYATMGGQVGDTGVIETAEWQIHRRRYHQASRRQIRSCRIYGIWHDFQERDRFL